MNVTFIFLDWKSYQNALEKKPSFSFIVDFSQKNGDFIISFPTVLTTE